MCVPLPSFQIQDFFCLQPVDDSQDIKNGLSNSRILPILFDLEFTHLGRDLIPGEDFQMEHALPLIGSPLLVCFYFYVILLPSLFPFLV